MCLSINDTDSGMDEQMLPRIFEPSILPGATGGPGWASSMVLSNHTTLEIDMTGQQGSTFPVLPAGIKKKLISVNAKQPQPCLTNSRARSGRSCSWKIIPKC